MLSLASHYCISINFINLYSQLTPNGKTKERKSKSKQKSKQSKEKNIKKIPKKKLVRKPKSKLKKQTTTVKTKKANEVPDEVKWMEEDPHDQLLSRFVETPKGTVVGESIGIEKTRIILKNKLKFYSIPLKYVKEKDDILILQRRVNWTRAEKLGEVWRKAALDIIPKNKAKKPNKPDRPKRRKSPKVKVKVK
jgi:hypothetical protein